MNQIFKPNFFMQNAHFQTVFATLFRKKIPLHFTKKEFTLSDGDFVETYWHDTQKQEQNTPLVVLFHGLAGSFESPYIRGSIKALNDAGFNCVIMHFRGCAQKQNTLARSYHSGDSGDALEFLNALKKEFPQTKLHAIGYSLGANMLLKLLGEIKENNLLESAVAVSAPMLLDICANRMMQGFSRYYQHRLLQDLNRSLEKKYSKHDMQTLLNLPQKEIKNIKTFWEFDEAYTAPIHGFSSAQDYYTKSSAKQFLKSIATPTLIIHAKDDPFMTPEVIPSPQELSNAITLEVSEKGGHVGFVGGTLFSPEYYLEQRILRFLSYNLHQTHS